jgi:hypothetical protein
MIPELHRKTNLMKKKSNSRSAFLDPRVFITLVFCAGGVLLALIALYPVPSARAQGARTNPTQSEEARIFAAGLKSLVNNSFEGLTPQKRADGSVYVNLEGRFQNVIVAKREDDGSLSQTCVNNPEAADAFLSATATKPLDR